MGPPMTPMKFQVITFANVEKTHTPGLQAEVSLCPFGIFFHFFINNFSPNWNLIWFKKLRILSWKLDIKKLIEVLGFLDKNSTFWNRVLLRGCIKSEKHLPPGNLPRKPNAEIMGLSGSWAVTETRTKKISKKWSALHCPKNQLGLYTVACLCFRERLVFTLSQ